jgi:capsular exopolysaccharide synthesis family protein
MESTENIDLDFNKLWRVIKLRWLPAVGIFSFSIILSGGLASLQKPGYEAQGKLLIKKNNDASVLTGLGERIGQLEGLDIKSSPISTEIEVVRSIPLLQKTINKLKLTDKAGKLVEADSLAKEISLKAIPATDVLSISYESKDPNKAADVVNKIMGVYIENNVLINRAEAIAAGDFIGKQIFPTEAYVHRAEMALRIFKERNKIVELDEESKSAVAVIKEIENKIYETKAALAEADARSASLQSKIGKNTEETIVQDNLNNSTGVKLALSNLQEVEADLAKQRTRYQEAHPLIIDLENKRNAIKALLDKRVIETGKTTQKVSTGDLQTGIIKQKLREDFIQIEVQRKGLSNRLQQLTEAEESYKQRMNILPKLAQEQRELERQLEAAQSTYQTLLKKLQEVRVTENQNIGNARIIEPAVVAQKSPTTKRIMILAVGGLVGIIIGTVSIVVSEIKDKSIKTLKETRELFRYTLLGTIPSTKKKLKHNRKDTEWTLPELPVKDTPHLPITESYRMLQANLKFLSSDKPLQAIVVTSSVPKEGKSTVSANLAAAMAQLGHRVLLVDADMRHPLQHHIWNLNNTAGLSDLIVGQADFSATVNEGIPNLHILTAGVIPPNPLALLDSKRMANLIKNFCTTYDFVIIDAPPLVLGADALTLGKMTDGVLLVARPGTLTSNSATVARESLERSSQKVLGLVVNGVILENESDSYFYYAQEYAKQDSVPAKVLK